MAGNETLEIILTLKDKASNQLKSFQSNFDKFNKKVSNVGVAAKKATMAMAAVGAATGVAGGFALREAAKFELLEKRFKVLLGTTEEAKARMAELNQFALVTPFQVDEIAQASAMLQTFGGDALATGEGLRFVGDMAAFSQQPISEIALHVGRTVDALQSGRPFGESAMRMQELGLLTGNARAELESFAGQTMSSDEALKLLQGSIKNVDGTMAEMNDTITGQLSNVEQQFRDKLRQVGEHISETFDVKETLRKFSETISKIDLQPLYKVIDAIGKGMIDLYNFIKAQGEKISKFLESDMGKRFIKVFNGIIDFFRNTVIPAIGKFLDTLMDGFILFLENVTPVLEGVGEILSRVVGVVSNLLQGDFMDAWNVAVRGVQGATTAMSVSTQAAGNAILQMMQGIAGSFSSLVTQINSTTSQAEANMLKLGLNAQLSKLTFGAASLDMVASMKKIEDASQDSILETGDEIEDFGGSMGAAGGAAGKMAEDAEQAFEKVSKDFDNSLGKISEKVKDLQSDLESIFGDYNNKESYERAKVGEAIIESENKVKELKREIAEEEDAERKDLLQKQLEQEIIAREELSERIKGFEKEVTEAKRISSLTQLQLSFENFDKEMKQAKELKDEKLKAYDEELEKVKEQVPELVALQEEKRNKILEFIGSEKEKANELTTEYANMAVQLRDTIKLINELSSKRASQSFANGGVVRGYADGGMVYAANGFMPRGRDTVPAMLTPGEVVLNAAQQKNVAGAIGGGNITFNFNGPVSSKEVAEEYMDLVVQKLKLSTKVV